MVVKFVAGVIILLSTYLFNLTHAAGYRGQGPDEVGQKVGVIQGDLQYSGQWQEVATLQQYKA